jgi:hypothetical protein
MGIEHQVAKMTAHGIQISGMGFGGLPELSQTDIAAALAGLHGPAYWLLRLKYCGDVSQAKPLAESIAWHMLGEAMAGGDDVSAQIARKLARVIVLQFTTGPVCEDCHGTGTAFEGTRVKDCQSCRGSGRLSMTAGRSAQLAGVSEPTYRKRYARLVNSEVARLEALENLAFSHMRRKIYGG